MASEQLAVLTELLRAAPIMSGEIADRRAFLDTPTQPFPEDARVEPVEMDGVPGDRVTAAGADRDDAAILWLHGGAYVIGSPMSHRNGAHAISAATGRPVYLADYRLAPEHQFPAAVDDACTAFRWLAKQTPAGTLVLGGDSAGGGLTAATLVSLRDAGDPLPAAAVLFSPWVDLVGTGDSWTTRVEVDPMCNPVGLREDAARYLGDTPAEHPLASPIHADLRGLPPMHITVGDAEVLLDDAVTLAERARAAGVDAIIDVWPQLIHVFPLFAGFLPEADEALQTVGEFVRSYVP